MRALVRLRRLQSECGYPVGGGSPISVKPPGREPWLAVAEPVDYEMVTRIRSEGLQRSQVMETLRGLTDGVGRNGPRSALRRTPLRNDRTDDSTRRVFARSRPIP